MDPELRRELYLSLLLLGADPMLLGALESSHDRELLADVRNWNEAKLLEIKEWLATMTGAELEAAQERIRQYEQVKEAA
jgi:hypothetical protein